jgi:hypothetical protein
LSSGHDPPELILLYIAMRRARESVDVPAPLLPMMGRRENFIDLSDALLALSFSD